MFAADMEKTFSLVDQDVIFAAVESFSLGPDFTQLIRALLCDKQSFVMNNGYSTGYFKLKRDPDLLDKRIRFRL